MGSSRWWRRWRQARTVKEETAANAQSSSTQGTPVTRIGNSNSESDDDDDDLATMEGRNDLKLTSWSQHAKRNKVMGLGQLRAGKTTI
jgi:hypothetical protein